MKRLFRILTGLVLVFSTSDSQLIPTSSEYYYAIIAVHRDLTHNIMLNPFLEVHGFIFKTSSYFLQDLELKKNDSPNATYCASHTSYILYSIQVKMSFLSQFNSLTGLTILTLLSIQLLSSKNKK